MKERVKMTIENIVSAPRAFGEVAADRSREAAHSAARLITRAKVPAHRLANAGLKINNVAHDSLELLLKQQMDMLEFVMDDSSKRLELAARARGLRTFLKDQMALMPDTRKRLAEDTRKTLDILTETREDLMEAVRTGLEKETKPRAVTAVQTGKRVTRKTRATAKKATARTKARAKKATARRRTTAKKAA